MNKLDNEQLVTLKAKLRRFRKTAKRLEREGKSYTTEMVHFAIAQVLSDIAVIESGARDDAA